MSAIHLGHLNQALLCEFLASAAFALSIHLPYFALLFNLNFIYIYIYIYQSISLWFAAKSFLEAWSFWLDIHLNHMVLLFTSRKTTNLFTYNQSAILGVRESVLFQKRITPDFWLFTFVCRPFFQVFSNTNSFILHPTFGSPRKAIRSSRISEAAIPGPQKAKEVCLIIRKWRQWRPLSWIYPLRFV